MGTSPEPIKANGEGEGLLSRRGWIILACVVVGLAVIAGGVYLLVRDTKPSPQAAAWASSVCTSVATWKTQTEKIATDVSGTPSKATFNDKISQIEAATTTMVNEIKAAPLPTASDSQSAKAEIDALIQDAQTTATKIKSQAQNLTGNGATGFAAGAATIVAESKALVDQAQTTMKNLKGLGSDLGKAVAHDKTCRSLT
jgi:hypothetical protein